MKKLNFMKRMIFLVALCAYFDLSCGRTTDEHNFNLIDGDGEKIEPDLIEGVMMQNFAQGNSFGDVVRFFLKPGASFMLAIFIVYCLSFMKKSSNSIDRIY